jgi:hypothetical protein
MRMIYALQKAVQRGTFWGDPPGTKLTVLQTSFPRKLLISGILMILNSKVIIRNGSHDGNRQIMKDAIPSM